MTALPLPQPEENDEEKLPFIPSTRMIEAATNQQVSTLNAEQVRKLRRIIRRDFTGCVVIVVKDGNVVKDGIYQIKQFIIEPTE